MIRIRVVALLLALIGVAHAQSSPGLYQGQVPTPAQWNSYFSAKQDVLTIPSSALLGGTGSGLTGVAVGSGLNLSGGTLTTLFGTTSGTAAQGNDARITGALQTTGGTINGNLSVTGALASSATNGQIFWANQQTSCTWSTSTSADVGPCINSAIAAAAAVGAGTVMIPAGTFYYGTEIIQHTSGVHLVGAGVGDSRDNSAPSTFQAITHLIWNGAAGAALMFDEEPTGTESMYSADVTGITFDGNNLADTCVKISQVSLSTIDVGGAECRDTNIWLSTNTSPDAPGSQHNIISLTSRSTSNTYAPTGILIDGGQGSSWNVSLNTFLRLSAIYNNGDGIVWGSSDNNVVIETDTYGLGGSGSPQVVATSGYVPPSGVALSSGVNFTGGSINFIGHVDSPITVQGFTPTATFTPGANSGTAALAPVTVSTSATAALFARTLTFTSTTGLAAGMDFSCTGGPASGIENHSAIARIDSGTTLDPTFYTVGAVASGLSCTFTWGANASAVPGTYTITATGASTYNITAPAGGNSQTGVSVSGGVLAFTDIVIPITGSAVSGDTFTVVIPTPRSQIVVQNIDSGNAIPDPYYTPGATGASSTTANPILAINALPVTSAGNGMDFGFGRSACANLPSGSNGQQSIVMGDCNGGSSGAFSFVGGGATVNVSGFSAGSVAGQNNTVSGNQGFIGGGIHDTVSGTYGRGAGAYATDRGGYGADVWSSGEFLVQGDAETRKSVLRGTGSSTSAIRVTADGATAGSANCINIPTNAAFQLHVDIEAFDHTTPANNEEWGAWTGQLTRGASNAALTMATTPTPISNGTVTGSSISATADTSNQCLNLSFTPPTSNTDTWHVVARVRTVETQ